MNNRKMRADAFLPQVMKEGETVVPVVFAVIRKAVGFEILPHIIGYEDCVFQINLKYFDETLSFSLDTTKT